MKEYKIYWIKEEFARHYYYKSDILYRFLREFHSQKYRVDLVSQFDFITESFPKDSLTLQLLRKPQNKLQNEKNIDIVDIKDKHSLISLHIEEKQIKFRCETLQDAETLLFPSLRQFHPFLFIIDDDYENYGWISPVRTSIGYNNEQVLYS
jgi:hypothetical protein